MKPNVRTYTALITAMGNAKQWRRALATIESMKHSQAWSNTVEPNAYTYSALLKSMSEQVTLGPEDLETGQHRASQRIQDWRLISRHSTGLKAGGNRALKHTGDEAYAYFTTFFWRALLAS